MGSMTVMPRESRDWTVEDLDLLPDDGLQYELRKRRSTATFRSAVCAVAMDFSCLRRGLAADDAALARGHLAHPC